MWRRRVSALALVAVGIAVVVIVAAGGGSARHARTTGVAGRRTTAPRSQTGRTSAGSRHRVGQPTRTAPRAPFAVGSLTLKLVDTSRTIRRPNGTVVPRTLVTIVRYPALGSPGPVEHAGAAAVTAAGRFPLIVFGHGFAVTPRPYARLLHAWAQAGYVVAAPVFPLGNKNAAGGPNETDLPNQPDDMKFVITRMLGASAAKSGPLVGLIAPHEIAVAGQSDGGDTALATAYDPPYRDPRVRAAVILSGAEIPFVSSFQILPGGPPLLATQGTADTINPPGMTYAFYDSAPPPKYLLLLLGASHLPPYSYQQPQLGTVERVTIAFLDHYLKGRKAALARMLKEGAMPGVSTLDAHP
jgi:fermentation-respiration switch protein FrsA (DUF1100 family)